MDIDLNLELQEPINFYGITIKLPTILEILRYDKKHGEGAFNRLITPYIISIDSLGDDVPDEVKGSIKNFDIVYSDDRLIDCLIESIKYFCETDDIESVVSGLKIDGVVLDRDNFDEFGDIILKINSRERYKAEPKPVYANERQRDIAEKLKEGRARMAKKNEVKLTDIINYCKFGGKSYIPASEIRKWTLWELMNAYKSILGVSGYENSYSAFLVSGNNKLVEGKHWTDLLKLSYKAKEE